MVMRVGKWGSACRPSVKEQQQDMRDAGANEGHKRKLSSKCSQKFMTIDWLGFCFLSKIVKKNMKIYIESHDY